MGSTEAYTFNLTTIQQMRIRLFILFMMVNCCLSCHVRVLCKCNNPFDKSTSAKTRHYGTPLYQCTTRRSCFVSCYDDCGDLVTVRKKTQTAPGLCRSKMSCLV